MLPAKYLVYKVVLTRRTPDSQAERQLNSWKVAMIMVTDETGVHMYKTSHKDGADARQFLAVGTPVYRLRNVEYAKSLYKNGVSTETYAAVYRGNIIPPEDRVSDPSRVIVGWESGSADGNALKVVWSIDDGMGKKVPLLSRGNYRLTFFCISAE